MKNLMKNASQTIRRVCVCVYDMCIHHGRGNELQPSSMTFVFRDAIHSPANAAHSSS